MPSWIRSSSVSSEPWYFFAIDTTSRRFALIIRSLAARSPRSMRFASSISSSGVSSRWRPISFRKSCSVSVVTVASAASSTGAARALAAAAVVAQVDPLALELLVEGADVGLLELQRLGQLVDLGEIEATPLPLLCRSRRRSPLPRRRWPLSSPSLTHRNGDAMKRQTAEPAFGKARRTGILHFRPVKRGTRTCSSASRGTRRAGSHHRRDDAAHREQRPYRRRRAPGRDPHA